MGFNHKIHSVSSKELIGEFLMDYDMQQSSFIGLLNRHIVRGIEIMRIDTYYTQCVKAFKTYNNRTPIPCNSKYIEAIVIDKGGNATFLDLTHHGFRLLSKDNLQGESELYGYADGGYANFKDFEGRGFFLYKSLPIDEEGYVRIPDDPFVKEALLNLLVAKLALSGYKHKVISRQEAEAKWGILYPQARNSVNFPSIEDMEEYTESNTNPLFNNIRRMSILEDSNIMDVATFATELIRLSHGGDFEEASEICGIKWSSTEL